MTIILAILLTLVKCLAKTMKQISQETFDEMVEENIDAFELEPEEALRATIEELELQGVDLSMIVKELPGTNLDDHPIAIATKKVGSPDSKDRESALEDLDKIFQQESSSVNELIAISGKFETLAALLSMFDDVSISLKSQQHICTVLKALLVDSSSMKSKFLQLNAFEKILVYSRNKDLLPSLLEVVVAICKKHEPAKCSFMDPEFLDVISACLESSSNVEVVFQVLTTLTTPDDPETSASQAFLHARLLSQQKFHLKAITILQTESKKTTNERNSSVVICGLDAIRCLAANDEICKEICEASGIEVCMELYKTSTSSPEIIKILNNAMRQLACSDLVKQTIMSLNGASIIAELLTVFENDGGVIEGLLGLMTVVTLRRPQFARAFCEEKCHESIKSVMVNFQSDPKVLRQGCLCVRNFVVRDPTIKELMIKLEIEPWIRKCKDKFKKQCGSEASSALRDLGFEDYK